MAIVKIKHITQRVNNAIDYIINENKVENKNYGEKRPDLINALEYIEKDFKTRNKQFVTGINCSIDDAYNQMQITKEAFGKKDKILAYHIIHSYDNEDITPELAHKIGVEFAQELFGDRFEVVVTTHTNTKHLHNHILVNSVSFKDGKKYYDNRETYAVMRKVSNNICKEYGLNVMNEKECSKSKINYQHYYNNYEMKNNYKNSTKHDIDLVISQAYSFIDFKEILNKLNYDVMIRYGKISVREKSYKRNIRIERTFGEEYSIDNIKHRILEEQSTRVPFIECYKFKKPKIYQKYSRRIYKKSKRKLGSWSRLYYHYCYLLKVYSNNSKVKSRQISAKIKQEVEKMNNYSKQVIFLDKHNINSIDELENFKTKKTEELENITIEKNRLLYSKRKEKTEDKKIKIENQLNCITNQINHIKVDLSIIDDIEEEHQKIIKKVREIGEIKNKEKEKIKKLLI